MPPQLELEGWRGERHPFGFVTSGSSGMRANGSGSIFGPSRLAPAVQRVTVMVGTGYRIDFSTPVATWLLAQELTESDEDRRRPISEAQPITPTPIDISIDGSPVAFDLAAYEQSWWAQGRWDGWYVEVSGTRIDPSDVKLRRPGAA
jgi:hypothetical protein